MHLNRKRLLLGLGAALVVGMVLAVVVPCRPQGHFLEWTSIAFLTVGALVTAVQLLHAAPLSLGLHVVWKDVLLALLLLPVVPLGGSLLFLSHVCF